MLQNDDLEAAIGAGIVTQAQADALLAFAAQRRSGAAGLRADEERFRFMRGFNDFFFAIGVVLLGAGIAMYVGMAQNSIVYALAAVVMWALAELLVRRLRLVLPGIVILIFFACFVVAAAPLVSLSEYSPSTRSINNYMGFTGILLSGNSLQMAAKAAIAAIAAAAFYARFRFPFALLVFGGGAVLAIVLSANNLLFANAAVPRLVLLLLCGLAAFAAAMRYDLSDRLRATRRSDCAFWLHVLAAPLLVHSLVALVSPRALQLNDFAAAMIVMIAVLLTLVALVIDRRALLVSALTYIGVVIAYTLAHAGATATAVGIATLVILGILVLALGVGWAPLRRQVARLMSPGLMNRLPPVVPA